ncbi:KaiC domain-containing protein [Halosimplex litoreum]|uniref:KaiC domain-containing protein n=1 Tax=Halosimplex litoreum TaxID=1198301 RepID=A0A7T3FWU6_9EURY|nr:KaiC domain-containing protein [Halosimplex litoreum]QPV62165.1 KaiC domain-containing protein [Halosimplex litoreum]
MSDDADDDWFEDALGDEESEASTAADDGSEATAEDAFDDAETDAQFDESDDSEPFGGESGVADSGGPGAFDDSSGADAFGGADDDGFADTGGDSPFGDVGTDEDNAFGDSGSGDAFGGDTDDGLFDDDFADAMGGVGGGDADFEDEDFESNIPRLDLGIEGLDNMVQGGIPLRHLIVIVGGAGTGKTTFGLQFLQHGLEKEDTDRGVFITLEQTYEDIMATAEERGWEFERHEAEGNLAVIDLDPVEMANSLDNIRGELPELIEDFDADRFVLDSVSLLEMMYDDVSSRRTEVFDFTQSLKEAGVTTVLTSEANEDNPYASRHGIIEYLTDAVLLLRYVRSETQETRLAVEIQKIRNANHSRETKPYEITMDGISVYEQANIF